METDCSHTCALSRHLRLQCGQVFSGKSRKEFVSLTKKTFYICGITFLIQEAKEDCLCCAPNARKPSTCDFQRAAVASLVWTLLVLNFSQQISSIQENSRFSPSPILLFLFSVNSSCRRNIDKYSRECFSGRRMLPKHFLTIFGKN